MSPPCAQCGYAAIDIEVPISPAALQLEGDQIASTSETLVIYDIIAAAEANISRIDDEITRLQAVLDGLARKRAAIHHHIQLHRVLVAPVRRLPPEILSEIFLQCRETKRMDIISLSCHSAKLDKAPLLLGSVCRRWRAIALSTPRLWTTFALTLQPKYVKYDVLLAKTWLGRSGTCPLSIMLESKSHSQNTMRPLMQVFLRYCERWSDIHLCIPQPVMHALSSAKNRLPMLQRLCISGSMNEPINTFENTPHLHHFHLDLPAFFTPSMVRIPWNQLRSFHTERRSVDSCLELLQLTPNLEECTVSHVRMNSPSPHPPVHLPHLRTINIHGNASLLEKLLLPNLRKLVVVVSHLLITASQFISLLSKCSLEVLSFDTAASLLSDFEMIRILGACPSLERLDLRNRAAICMSKRLIARLACFRDRGNSSEPQLVPKLHTITIDYTPSHFDMLAFADAIESRMTSSGGEDSASDNALVTELKTVEIRHIPAQENELLDPTVLSRLHRLKDNGLKISVMRELEYLL